MRLRGLTDYKEEIAQSVAAPAGAFGGKQMTTKPDSLSDGKCAVAIA